MRARIASLLCVVLMSVSARAATPKTVTLDVQNMDCASCKLTIRLALEMVPGVTEAKVDYKKKTATVKYDADKTGTDALTKATANAGYPSTVRK